ncbi:MAG: ParB/RepB/Spo0J family partition protein [Bacteroidaceae bacterium]|nr:ParB/RepB/Spo0J family partition protein [Bacteroidaceae bacterium]
MAVRKKFGPALGRGLDALISTEDVRPEGSSTINEIDVNLIERNPNQPRREFEEEALQELADSISEIGIIQPITLRELDNGRYQIIAGERRWRASQIAGLSTIPAYIRTASDENVMEMALVENIQRQDLNSIEIALAYQHLIDAYGLTQEKLSERVGKKRATVANYLRLLKLPAPVQVAIQNHQIDTGHARALLAIEDPKEQVRLFKDIQSKGYSVRQVEEIIKNMNEGANVVEAKAKAESPKTLTMEFEDLRRQFSQLIGADVKISCSAKGSGKLSFSFKDTDDLRRIISLIQNN